MSTEFRLGAWLVQPSQNTITGNGKSTRLEPKMVEVLVCLAERQGETVSKEQLIQRVWGDTFVTDDVLTRCISELRRRWRMMSRIRTSSRRSPGRDTGWYCGLRQSSQSRRRISGVT